jgi:hypothetical protein
MTTPYEMTKRDLLDLWLFAEMKMLELNTPAILWLDSCWQPAEE